MKILLTLFFLLFSPSVFTEARQDWNPWSSTKKNLDDLNIESIIVNLSNIGAARIVKTIEGIENFDVSKPITAKEIEGIKNLDNKKCIFWFDGTKFCVFK